MEVGQCLVTPCKDSGREVMRPAAVTADFGTIPGGSSESSFFSSAYSDAPSFWTLQAKPFGFDGQADEGPEKQAVNESLHASSRLGTPSPKDVSGFVRTCGLCARAWHKPAMLLMLMLMLRAAA